MKNLLVGTGAILNRPSPSLRLEFGLSPTIVKYSALNVQSLLRLAWLSVGQEWKSAKLGEASLSPATSY